MDSLLEKIIVGIVSLVVGSVLTLLARKSASLSYSISVQRVGLTHQDPAFGAIEVRFQGNPIPNLFAAQIVIENPTLRDFSDIVFRVAVEDNSALFSEHVRIAGTTFMIEWSDDYKKNALPTPGTEATQTQKNIYARMREYRIRTFNRGQKIEAMYLCTAQDQRTGPRLKVELQHPGVKLVARNTKIFPIDPSMTPAIIIGLLNALFIAAICALYFSAGWAALISVLAGLCATLIGLIEYKAYKQVRQWIGG